MESIQMMNTWLNFNVIIKNRIMTDALKKPIFCSKLSGFIHYQTFEEGVEKPKLLKRMETMLLISNLYKYP